MSDGKQGMATGGFPPAVSSASSSEIEWEPWPPSFESVTEIHFIVLLHLFASHLSRLRRSEIRNAFAMQGEISVGIAPRL